MEIMQQSATNHLDGRWRPHLLPYSGAHTLSSLPSLHDHIRQQMISQQQPDHLQPHNTANEHLQQQQIHHQQQQQQLPQMSHRQDQQLQQQQQHRQIIVQHQQRRDPTQQSPSKEQQPLASSRGGGRGGGSGNGLPSPALQLNSLSLQSSPSSASPSTPSTPSPPAPSPGKSGGKDGEEKKGEEWEQYNAGAAFLGPTLWDKTLSYDSDLKLEYMDLDEFLNENGIPIDESKRNGNNATGGGSSNVGHPPNTNNSSSSSSSSSSMRPSAQSPEAPSSPENSPPQMGSGMGACPHAASVSMTNVAAAAAVAASGPISVVPPPALSPQDYIGDCSSSISSPGSPDPHSPLQVHEPEEELKPQPMIKKSRKQFVPAELKDDKYWARRRKNNMAAKRSRDARRLKENQIAMRANFLEKENNAMTVELQKAQAIVESLKKRLAMYEAV